MYPVWDGWDIFLKSEVLFVYKSYLVNKLVYQILLLSKNSLLPPMRELCIQRSTVASGSSVRPGRFLASEDGRLQLWKDVQMTFSSEVLWCLHEN